MSQVQDGYQRDRAIVAAVADWRALTTEQIASLLFPIPSGLRKAQMRLKRIHEQGRIYRCRLESSYCYYAERRPGQLDHVVAVNWVRLWFGVRARSWETVTSWEYEAAYKGLRADAVCVTHNKFTGEYSAWFVELDRTASHNPWDKAGRYNELYSSGDYAGAWWVSMVKRFPGVICVADSSTKAAEIRRAVERSNEHGLRFEVRLLEELIAEVRRA